jgi:hypothetical protein
MKKNTKLLLFVTLIIAFSSCVKKDPITRIAQISFSPLSPNATAVNFAFGKTIFATQVNYSSVTPVVTQRYTFPYYTVTPQKGNITYNTQTTNLPLASINDFNLEDEKSYSTFLIDSASKTRAIIVNDNLEDPNEGFIKIRFYNFCANAPAVNVNIVGETTNRWANRSFETQATASANERFIELPANNYTFEVRNASNGALITTITSQAYLPERIYTIAVRGFIGGTGNQAVAGWLYPNKP